MALGQSRSGAVDPTLGVGPDHIFQMVNTVGRITDKTGHVLATFPHETFFGIDPGFFSGDARVIYDALSGRWLATAFHVPPDAGSTVAPVSSVVLTVSATSDPTGPYCRFRLGNPTSESGFKHDFPTIGVSSDKVVVAYNGLARLPSGGSVIVGGGLYVLNKADLLACVRPRMTRIAPAAALIDAFPAQALTTAGDVYLLRNNGSSLTVITVSGVPGETAVSQTSRSLAIRTWDAAGDVPQRGTSRVLAIFGSRVHSAAWQGHSLWLAGHESCQPPGDVAARACIRVIEIRTDAMTVRQDITHGDAGKYYFFPSLRPDAGGNLHLVFNASSPSDFPGVRATGRRATDPLGTLQPSIEIHAGDGSEDDGRFADFSGAALDPADPSTVWVTGEYLRSTTPEATVPDWATVVAALQWPKPAVPPPPPQPPPPPGPPPPASATLSVAKAGTGAGTVTSAPAGIVCGAVCSQSVARGALVTLTAVAEPGSLFVGWTAGGCAGVVACDVTVAEDTAVVATFVARVPGAVTLLAAVLPSSRSVQIGVPATAFATIINAGPETAIACSLAPAVGVPAAFTFQATDSATNQVTGTPNTPVDVPAGAGQSFVFALVPVAPFEPSEIPFEFSCANAAPASIRAGLNTLLLSASATAVPDVVALAATLGGDGIVDVPRGGGSGVFAVATANVGGAGVITASADTGIARLPIAITVCATEPATGACTTPPARTVTTPIAAGTTPTFGFFVVANDAVPFDPAGSRIYVRFSDSAGLVRGSTSVAVRAP